MVELLSGWIGTGHPVLNWIDVALSTVGLFALVATKTGTKTDDKIAQILLDVINFAGGNWGKARNSG